MLFWFADDGSTFSHMRVLPLCIKSIFMSTPDWIVWSYKRTLLIITPDISGGLGHSICLWWWITDCEVYTVANLKLHSYCYLKIQYPISYSILAEAEILTTYIYLPHRHSCIIWISTNFFSFPSIYMAVVQIKVNKSKEGHFW